MRRLETAVAPLMSFVLTTLGCQTSSDSSALPTATPVTSIYLDPSFFMGDMPCAASEGAMQSYVAAIYDVTNDQIVTLAAAPPVTCSAGVTFQQVVVDRKYRIKIDGYDVPASALTPLGGLSSGSRTMLLKANPDAGPVTPRWTTHCDDVTAEKDSRVNASTCAAFTQPPTPTGIRIDPRVAMKSAMPALTCQRPVVDSMGNITIEGDVFALHVRPDNPSLPALLDVDCLDETPAPSPYTQGIVPGQTYRFRIEGIAQASGPVVWGSSCFAVPTKDLVVQAQCDPLRANGGMDVVIDAETCTKADAVTYDVEFAGPPKESIPGIACGKSVRLSPLPKGTQAATVVGYRADGSVALEATCSADVEPGLVSVATCMFF